MLMKAKEVRIFSNAGVEMGRISFKTPIYDSYWDANSVQVHTATKVFKFSLGQSIAGVF